MGTDTNPANADGALDPTDGTIERWLHSDFAWKSGDAVYLAVCKTVKALTDASAAPNHFVIVVDQEVKEFLRSSVESDFHQWLLHECGIAVSFAEHNALETLAETSTYEICSLRGRQMEKLMSGFFGLAETYEKLDIVSEKLKLITNSIEHGSVKALCRTSQPPTLGQSLRRLDDQIQGCKRLVLLLMMLMYQRIQRVCTLPYRGALHQSITVYCGLSWSKRAWFVLHGGHPPPESRLLNMPSVGCA